MQRLDDMRCGSPAPLTLIHWIVAMPDLEPLLHVAFAPVRSHGEWFRLPEWWREAADHVAKTYATDPETAAIVAGMYADRVARKADESQEAS